MVYQHQGAEKADQSRKRCSKDENELGERSGQYPSDSHNLRTTALRRCSTADAAMSDPIQQVEVYQQGRVLKRVACERVAVPARLDDVATAIKRLSRNCHRCCHPVKR